ncbi:hypothetical protein ACVWYQ_006404 [Bradyrhizobium sp. USDA 3397]
MIYRCRNRRRRDLVEQQNMLNGIDFLEVVDRSAPVHTPRQRTLLVRLLRPAASLSGANVMIEGGERITQIRVSWAHPANAIPPAALGNEDAAFFSGLPEAAKTLVVRTDVAGDYATYRLRIVLAPGDPQPRNDFDPPLSFVDFSFKVECPNEFDCHPERAEAVTPTPAPPINYLAKDYASFRRLILDRLSMLMPAWRDRNPADVGMTLVELLAYVADHLSYEQDAVATEAYLGTARRRLSVRRHARMVDYRMHDGGNARAWVQLKLVPSGNPQTQGEGVPVATKTKLLTRVADAAGRIGLIGVPGRPNPLSLALDQNPTVFETLHPVTLFEAHDRMAFYTWSEGECCLPRGATRATLKGHFPHLDAVAPARRGDVLIFEEVLSPITGRAEDADPIMRHAVLLTAVRAFKHKVNPGDPDEPLTDPAFPTNEITEIAWGEEDALPFSLSISSRTDADHGRIALEGVSVARGNIVLADHGHTIEAEPLGPVPSPRASLERTSATHGHSEAQRSARPPRFRPSLRSGPLTHRIVFDDTALPRSARAAMLWSPDELQPDLELVESSSPQKLSWKPRPDLLKSGADARHFVAEMEDDRAVLRFGDDRHGMRAPTGTTFTATYRIGQGSAGNVGAEALVHVVSDHGRLAGARNPLPATGGLDPESIEEVRQRAPFAFRTLQRAVTEEDYSAIAERHPDVGRAAATLRWTGSWHTAFVTIDRLNARAVTPKFELAMRGHLERYRLAGHDVEVDGPRFVPLELDLSICVNRDHFRSNVKAAVLEALSSRVLADGRRGMFHQDNLTFGQPIYLGVIYAAVQAIPGVESVEITRFHRIGEPDRKALEAGQIEFGRLEIARLDNDPNFRERGLLRLTMGGGK